MRFLPLALVGSALLLAQQPPDTAKAPEKPATQKPAAAKPGPKMTDIVATINGQPWTRSELEAAYKKNIDKYTTAKVKAIYISFVTPPAEGPSEASAKAKAEDVYKQLKAGAEFSKMVQAHSEMLKEQDGSLGLVTKADAIAD